MRSLGLMLGAALCSACAPTEIVMTKPGVSQAQMDRDKRQCETQAQRASEAQLRQAKEKIQVHNRVLVSCMRGRGYEVVDPATVDKP